VAMPAPVLYVRGFPGSFESPDPAMIGDLNAIGALSADQISELVGALSAASGFLDSKRLTELVRAVVSEQRPTKAVIRALQNLEPDDVLRVLAAFERVRENKKKGKTHDPSIDAVRRNLTTLIQVYPALARHEKAERLATLTGQQLESFDLVCDVRPLFDESRIRIEGMIPYTTMRVVATGVDGLPRAFEVELSLEEVHELSEKVEKAKTKLATLRSSVESWMPDSVPELPLTRMPQKDSTNA